MDSQGDRKSGRTRRQKYLLKTVTVSSQPELARPMLQPCHPFNAHYHPFIAGPQCLSHFVFEWVSLCSFGHIHTHTQAHIVKGPCVSAFIAVGVAQAVGGRAGGTDGDTLPNDNATMLPGSEATLRKMP